MKVLSVHEEGPPCSLPYLGFLDRGSQKLSVPLNSAPLNPKILNLKSCAPKPQTPNPKPQTLNPKP